MISKLIHLRDREENIARCRSPISKEMFVAITNQASDLDRDSAVSVTFDWITLGRVAPCAEASLTLEQQGSVSGWVSIVFGRGEGGDGGAEIGRNRDGDVGGQLWEDKCRHCVQYELDLGFGRWVFEEA